MKPASAGSSARFLPWAVVSLTDLLENDSATSSPRLGVTLDGVDPRQLVIDLPDGSIDLTVIDPQPAWARPRPLSTAASSPACFFAKMASPSFNVFQ